MKPIIRNMQWAGAAGLLAAFLTGCASGRVYRMYDGPPRPGGEVARLAVPNAIDLYSIDGKVVHDFLLKAGASEVDLLPGVHAVAARYDQIWFEGLDGQRAVKSGLVGIQFDARAGHRYRIAFPEPQDLENAVKFAEHVHLWIEELGAGPVAIPANAPPSSAAVPSPALTPAANAAPADSLPLQNLKFWWQKADDRDRRQFREWMPPAP